MENSGDVRDTIQRYLYALRTAKTDSEKFASLLVVAQIEKNLKLTVQERKAVYESIDLDFIKSLLNAQKEPEGCQKGSSMSLGLTIASCIINEIEGACTSPAFQQMVPRILTITYEVGSNREGEEKGSDHLQKDVIENCFCILAFIASNEVGCKHIMDHLSSKSKTPLEKETSIKVLQLVVKCIIELDETTAVSFQDAVKDVFYQAASLFSLAKDVDKFTLLGLILDLVSASIEKRMFDNHGNAFTTELKLLRKGLLDIMQSKVDKKYRHMSLKLISELFEMFGLNWTCISFQDEDEKYSKKFLHFLVSLTSVEIKMLFFDKNLDIAFMSYMFAIIERTIESLSANEHDIIGSNLGENMASKILETISGVIKEVMYFLDEIKETTETVDACKDMKITACVRLLCAYMSEETQALEKEVLKIAPYLIELGNVSFHVHKKELMGYIDPRGRKSKPAIIFMFLLPVLCHWSADDKTRLMILEANLHKTLWEFLDMLLTSQNEACFESIETLIGIFMNTAITEPSLASDPKNIFGPMLKLIMLKISEYSKAPVQLLLNIVTLGLILARAQLHLQNDNGEKLSIFFRQCLRCYYDACPFFYSESKREDAKWAEISELWFVGMDNLTACVVQSKQVKDMLRADAVVQQINDFVDKNDSNEDTKEIKAVLKNLVTILRQ